MKKTVKKYSLDDCVQLQTKVVQAAWDEPSSKWRLKISHSGQEKEVECDVLINGSGFLKYVWAATFGVVIPFRPHSADVSLATGAGRTSKVSMTSKATWFTRQIGLFCSVYRAT